MTTELEAMLAEDRRRIAASRRDDYEQRRGTGCCGKRVEADVPGGGKAYVPESMVADPQFALTGADANSWQRLRCRHDFEYWAYTCVKIKDKSTGRDIPFRLNRPQRKVLAVLEGQRLEGRPLRIIILKARQWGGSTLVQMYMAWIQSCHRTNWNSVICAHVKDTSATIRGMYTKMLDNYPEELWEGDEKPAFRPFERSQNVREIAGRGCRVTLGSGEKPDSVRGADFAMAHLSETAYWPATRLRSPAQVVQAICGSIALMPLTLVAIESTARGVGDFFHAEWLRAKRGESDKAAIFVPWYMIDIYRLAPADPTEVLGSLSEYERWLWNLGCDSEQINWYRLKSREYETLERMHAEFPSDDIEAFALNTDAVFSPTRVEELRKNCLEPAFVGEPDTDGTHFTADPKGRMKIWEKPRSGARYVVAVDVGGRSSGSDWSVVAVLEAKAGGPVVAAQWRGHCDHDILARKSMAIAAYYNTALLVIESNTFETANFGSSCDSNLFILNRLAEAYPNMYMRRSYDVLTSRTSSRVGFHTNSSTKAMLIAGLIEAVRDGLYIERDTMACDELITYEQLPNGSYAAKTGYHDDILMTRAIALHVIATTPGITAQVPADFPRPEHW